VKVEIGKPNSIMLQFSFSNSMVLPEGLRARIQESADEARTRWVAGGGTQIIETTTGVSLKNLLIQIETSGYTLVSCTTQERKNRSDRINHTVRFVLVRSNLVEELPEDHAPLFEAFDKLASALWRVRVFRNSVEGSESGETMLSINLEARQPFFNFAGDRMNPRPKTGYIFKAGGGNLILERVV
jgi:hypothetical protein